jgi:predicted TIM-barrel fold metal-dependent hydrolase
MAVEIATRVVDGDGHVLEDVAAIYELLAPEYRAFVRSADALFPPLDHVHSGMPFTIPPVREGRGNPGPTGWKQFLDESGIAWTVLYPTIALAYGKMPTPDYAVALCRAYNDWLHQTYVTADPRFKGIAIVPMQDPPAAAKELRRAVTELGFIGAMLPSNGLALPFSSPFYAPLFDEANRLGAPLSVHGGCHDRFGFDFQPAYIPIHAMGHPTGLMHCCADMTYNGMFERYPNLRVAYLEGGVAWLLLLLERLHDSHEAIFQYVPPEGLMIREGQDPRKYIKSLIADDRIYLGIETEELTLPFALQVVGNRPFLYSSDFPHEVTLESCRHDIGELMESTLISEDDKLAMLHRNAERFYQLKP